MRDPLSTHRVGRRPGGISRAGLPQFDDDFDADFDKFSKKVFRLAWAGFIGWAIFWAVVITAAIVVGFKIAS